MKSVAAIFFLLFSIQALADNSPVEEAVSFDRIYVADGFDDNDNVQIVGEGMFANACYRHSRTKAKVDQKKMTIELAPVAYRYQGFCLQVILPFERVVDIGVLKAGTYTITQNNGLKRTLGKLHVAKSRSSGADDFMYSPISQAFFQSRFMTNRVFLIGDFPMSCMKIKEVKVNVQAHVLVVQPIAEIDPNVPCVSGKYTFEQVAELGNVTPGRYLLHVRTLNGQAVNTLVDVKSFE